VEVIEAQESIGRLRDAIFPGLERIASEHKALRAEPVFLQGEVGKTSRGYRQVTSLVEFRSGEKL
jgi:hypothetical protein